MPLCASAACCARHPKACRHEPSHPARAWRPARREPRPHAQSDAAAARLLRSVAIGGEVAISHTNGANLPFARNWYAHLQRAGVRNFAMIATDDEAQDALQRELPSQVVRCPDAIAGAHGRAQPLRYRSAGWTRLMFAVPKMVRWVLRMELDVLWMDTDVVAITDPFPVRAPPPSVRPARSRASPPLRERTLMPARRAAGAPPADRRPAQGGAEPARVGRWPLP